MKKDFVGKMFGEFKIDYFVKDGKHGMVFHAKDLAGIEAACKILKADKVRPGWDFEAKKAGHLAGIENVVQYKGCGTSPDGEHVYLLYEFVHGKTLGELLESEPQTITIRFVLDLAEAILSVCHAIKQVDSSWSHGDLHEGNVMISDLDQRLDPPKRRILVTDFGIGSSINDLEPKDDLLSLAHLLVLCLDKIDPSELGPEDRYVYDNLTSALLKSVQEYDPTVPVFSSPADLRKLIEKIEKEAKTSERRRTPPTLEHPFDYLSCEQLGETPLLLTKLFSPEFLGHPDLVSRGNIIFTGPRGCGKSTVFRNLSLRDQVLAGKRSGSNVGDYIGIYYQASDLWYAFPYVEETDEVFLKVTSHYLNLAIAEKIFDVLALLENDDITLTSAQQAGEIQGYVASNFPSYSFPPSGTHPLTHISRFLRNERLRLRKNLASGIRASLPKSVLPLDFLKNLCALLTNQIPMLATRPFFIFIDDYSLPKIRVELQRSLNRILFQRNPEVCFKVSVESVAGIELRDSDGKEFEDGRDFEMIDLGSYFIDPESRKDKADFIKGIVNSRLNITRNWYYTNIVDILGSSKPNYNQMARQLRRDVSSTKSRPMYHGFETLVDLCSGDISQIFLALRDMIDTAGGPGRFFKRDSKVCPLPAEMQDASISRLGGLFIERIGNVRFYERETKNKVQTFLRTSARDPESINQDTFDLGVHLRRILEAVGEVAHWELMNLDSKNLDQNPPKQATRIEVRDTIVFPNPELREVYSQLLQYGILIRDVRGKSLRGAVVPRLVLRRLLIPKFRLTFSHRDNIGVSNDEFLLLLTDPKSWEKHMKSKRRRSITWQSQTRL